MERAEELRKALLSIIEEACEERERLSFVDWAERQARLALAVDDRKLGKTDYPTILHAQEAHRAALALSLVKDLRYDLQGKQTGADFRFVFGLLDKLEAMFQKDN